MYSKTNYLKLKRVLGSILLLSTGVTYGQTNVFDNVIATSPNHTILEAALIQEGLNDDLQNASATLTVFAPTDDALNALAAALGTDANGLLALPNLDSILLYHVLGITAPSSAVTNGLIATPLNATNTIKFTKTSLGEIFVNQAKVTTADLTADNGVVHVTDQVILPVKTVVDVAINNNFTTLTAALIKAELIPALSNPLGTFTVFAPTNAAFDTLASNLGTDLNGILALPNLADVLLYHVLGSEVADSTITNGSTVNPLSTSNSLKLTKTNGGNVFINQAKVTLADVDADNGLVHVLDAVVLPSNTVVDVAIDNGFSTLVAAVQKAELVPALSDPFGTYTVFAPTNAAFDTLASNLGTDLNGILALPNLADILLYHVIGNEVVSTGLTNGNLLTLSGNNVTVDLTNGVKINDATVVLADVQADNGVVHVINKVLLYTPTSVAKRSLESISISPNPANDFIRINNIEGTFQILNSNGALIKEGYTSEKINISDLSTGLYFVNVRSANGMIVSKFMKQ